MIGVLWRPSNAIFYNPGDYFRKCASGSPVLQPSGPPGLAVTLGTPSGPSDSIGSGTVPLTSDIGGEVRFGGKEWFLAGLHVPTPVCAPSTDWIRHRDYSAMVDHELIFISDSQNFNHQ